MFRGSKRDFHSSLRYLSLTTPIKSAISCSPSPSYLSIQASQRICYTQYNIEQTRRSIRPESIPQSAVKFVKTVFSYTFNSQHLLIIPIRSSLSRTNWQKRPKFDSLILWIISRLFLTGDIILYNRDWIWFIEWNFLMLFVFKTFRSIGRWN